MRKLEIHPQSGGRNGVRTRLRNQMKRLFDCTVVAEQKNTSGKNGPKLIDEALDFLFKRYKKVIMIIN